jgi:hypothetical protein
MRNSTKKRFAIVNIRRIVIIIALVSVLAIAALQFLGQKASNTLSNAASYLS